MAETEAPELLDRDDFRAALEQAIKGREAKNASFSTAWANGELERHHFARWAENHYHYVGPFADYLGYIYANTPDHRHRRQGLPPPEHVRGGARRRPPHRPADPLRRGLRHHPRARDRHRQHDRRHQGPAGLVLRHRHPRALRRRHRGARGRPRVAGAVDLPPPVPGAAREVRLHRGRGRVLRPPHHLRRGARRARLPDRARPRRPPSSCSSAASSSCATAPTCGSRTPRRCTTPTSPPSCSRPDAGSTTPDCHPVRACPRSTSAPAVAPSSSTRATTSTCSASRSGTRPVCRSGARAGTAAPTGCSSSPGPSTSALRASASARCSAPSCIAAGYRLACQTYVEGDVTVSWDPDQQALISDRAAEALTKKWLSGEGEPRPDRDA